MGAGAGCLQVPIDVVVAALLQQWSPLTLLMLSGMIDVDVRHDMYAMDRSHRTMGRPDLCVQWLQKHHLQERQCLRASRMILALALALKNPKADHRCQCVYSLVSVSHHLAICGPSYSTDWVGKGEHLRWPPLVHLAAAGAAGFVSALLFGIWSAVQCNQSCS